MGFLLLAAEHWLLLFLWSPHVAAWPLRFIAGVDEAAGALFAYLAIVVGIALLFALLVAMSLAMAAVAIAVVVWALRVPGIM